MSNDFGLWDVIVSMFFFMLLISWISLILRIFGDIFRDRDLGGGAKAVWILALIFLPWLGALLYIIMRGNGMAQRSVQAMQEQDASFRAYVRDAAGSTSSSADELRKLAELRDNNTITAAEYEQAKNKVLA